MERTRLGERDRGRKKNKRREKKDQQKRKSEYCREKIGKWETGLKAESTNKTRIH